MSLSHVTDHYEQAVARLPMVYKDKPRYLAWLAAYCAKVQEIEDVVWDIIVDRMIQNSPTGDLLAKLGALVGQPSWGQPDAVWLLLIQARILANRSHGRRRDLIAITRAMWPTSSQPDVWVYKFDPMSVSVIPQAAVPMLPSLQADLLLPAAAAAERINYIWSPEAPSATVVPASVHAVGFVATPPCTTPDVTTVQYTGSVHHAGFAAGPVPTNTGGGVLAGVIAN